MSSLGKRVRMNRIFSHPSRRILSVAVDHMCNYPMGMPAGIRDMADCLRQIVAGEPSAITMNKGIAMRYMEPYAGKVPFIVQQMVVRPHPDEYFGAHASVAEVVGLGADAIAVAICVKNKTEADQIKHLASVVREAEPYGLPVIPHIYPIGAEDEGHSVSLLADDVFYAARIGIEMGSDIVKVPYTGDVASFRDIVNCSPVPIVSAGGPTCKTIEDAESMIAEVVASGAAGATVGRNIWGFPDPAEATRRLKRIVFGE
ncbi:MAG: 2-amino-3,7-dideoxy-D-threo-hept-6-ulosonate synthase [Candidatus Hydrogenedentota bacterium]